MTNIAGTWVPESEDATSPWGIRLAAIKLGLRNRGEEHTAKIGSQTLAELERKNINHGWTRSHDIETCTPQVQSPTPFDKQAHWEKLQSQRFDEFQSATGPVLWEDIAGSGKTINAALGAASRGIKHAILFSTHEKAREHIQDDVTPDDYLHLKGPEQPAHDCCLDAKCEADEDENAHCPKHGKESNWDLMCPLRELDEDNERRQQFEAYSSIKSSSEAHEQFCTDECLWAAQFDDLENTDRVVGVHEHQELLEDHDFTVIVDETPRLNEQKNTLSVADLRRMGSLLFALDAQTIGEFVQEDLLDAVVEGTLDGLTAPDIDAYNIAEKLTKLKIQYNESLERRIVLDLWERAPACFDAIIAVLAEIGLPDEACREAIAAPSTLDYCPHCEAPTRFYQRRRECVSCYWEEDRFSVLPHKDRDRERALAVIRTKEDPNISENQLCFTSLPDPSDLPDSPLILDATATPEKVAGFYGVPLDKVTVHGNEPFELNARIRQISDGAYHQGTIKDAFADDNRKLDERFQKAIDAISKKHERPLFITQRDLLCEFDFPEVAETRYYWNLRGLNMQEFDAVICIGGPHPNLDSMEDKARLLAMNHPDLEVGGEEHSTRKGAPNPPIYRKLNYEDKGGQGRAVPAKHYTGLYGALFREGREKELEQAVHRIRPLLAEGVKHVYLLTNVPTTLPVDAFVELDAFSTEPLATHLPMEEDAVEHLLQPLEDIANGESPLYIDGVVVADESISATIEGFQEIAQESGVTWSESTLRRRVEDLEELGLLTKGEYQQNIGYRYTVEKSALSRALLVLRSIGEEAELVSRFRLKTENAEGSTEWLDWACEKVVK